MNDLQPAPRDTEPLPADLATPRDDHPVRNAVALYGTGALGLAVAALAAYGATFL